MLHAWLRFVEVVQETLLGGWYDKRVGGLLCPGKDEVWFSKRVFELLGFFSAVFTERARIKIAVILNCQFLHFDNLHIRLRFFILLVSG